VESLEERTDKTDKTPDSEVLSVLSSASLGNPQNLGGAAPELAPLLAAYPGAEICIRPATPIPLLPALPRLMSDAARRKWLARETSKFGLVNLDLPGPRLPPRLPAHQRSLRPPPIEEEAVPANTCIHCGEPVATTDMIEGIALPGGQWEHLSCWLRRKST
jgi:hypothetical protein